MSGTLSSEHETGAKKRRKFSVQRFGFDATDSEVEDEEEAEEAVRPKKLKLKRSDAMKTPLFPSPPMTSLGQISKETIHNTKQRANSNETPCQLPTVPTPHRDSLLTNGSTGNISISEQTFNSADLGGAPRRVDCHCPHQEYWAKELLTVALRMEQYLHKRIDQLRDFPTEDDTFAEDSQSTSYYVTTSDEICRLFDELGDDANKRADVVKTVSKEVTKNKKKSIQRILLNIAPPKAWKDFSKNGQRGKRSALAIGLNKFLVECLNRSELVSQTNLSCVNFS